MVIDTSALLGIALGEPRRQALLEHIQAASRRTVSAISLLEAGIVLRARLGPSSVPWLYQLVEELGAEVVPFEEVRARLAIAATDLTVVRG